ncbi:hypothetical protein LEP1GSC195_2805 [Leptospira wolbachii serovar Codice str. CDC]|uniref:Uncharacterized protein n=1 Tax=Leptospira wolbachii serovar Codice str. CDC TaxID=1218599 RepID=R9A2V5_9LEPT|nr:hypothetical protein LEP1GSC195_2805 [Leptospira wolbachii serovar Codice str. CDC]
MFHRIPDSDSFQNSMRVFIVCKGKKKGIILFLRILLVFVP